MIGKIITTIVGTVALPQILAKFNLSTDVQHSAQLVILGVFLENLTKLPPLGVEWSTVTSFAELEAAMRQLPVDYSTKGLKFPTVVFKQLIEWSKSYAEDEKMLSALYYTAGPKLLDTPYELWHSKETPEIMALMKYLSVDELWPFIVTLIAISFFASKSASLSRWSSLLSFATFACGATSMWRVFNNENFYARSTFVQHAPRLILFSAAALIFIESNYMYKMRKDNVVALKISQTNQQLMRDVGKISALQCAQQVVSEDSQLLSKQRSAMKSVKYPSSAAATGEDIIHDIQGPTATNFMVAGRNYEHTREILGLNVQKQ